MELLPMVVYGTLTAISCTAESIYSKGDQGLPEQIEQRCVDGGRRSYSWKLGCLDNDLRNSNRPGILGHCYHRHPSNHRLPHWHFPERTLVETIGRADPQRHIASKVHFDLVDSYRCRHHLCREPVVAELPAIHYFLLLA